MRGSSVRVLVLGAALVGGICLVARLFVDAAALEWVGLVLLAVAVGAAATGLVRQPWLAAVAGAGSVALAYAVLETARSVGPDREVVAVAGGLATLCVAGALVRGPRRQVDRPGNHRS